MFWGKSRRSRQCLGLTMLQSVVVVAVDCITNLGPPWGSNAPEQVVTLWNSSAAEEEAETEEEEEDFFGSSESKSWL